MKKPAIQFDVVWKVAALLFTAGMLYQNLKGTIEETRKDAARTQVQVDKLEQYLDARQRNGL